MTEIKLPKRCKLERAEIDYKTSNIVFTLTGDDETLNDAWTKLQAPQRSFFTERGYKKIKINTSPTNAYKVAANIFDLTDCRLSGLAFKPSVMKLKIAEGKFAYQPSFIVTPLQDPTDPDNCIGQYAVDVIRLKGEHLPASCITDPMAKELGTTKIFSPNECYPHKEIALEKTHVLINAMEQHFGEASLHPHNLKLVGMGTHKHRGSDGMRYCVTAMLEGREKSLQEAFDELHSWYHGRVEGEMIDNNHRMKITIAYPDKDHTHSFLEALHRITGCELPLEIVAGVISHELWADKFKPCLDMHLNRHLRESVRKTTKNELTSYAAKYVPESTLIMPKAGDEHGRVVIHRMYEKERQAQEVAEETKDKLTKSLRDNVLPKSR